MIRSRLLLSAAFVAIAGSGPAFSQGPVLLDEIDVEATQAQTAPATSSSAAAPAGESEQKPTVATRAKTVVTTRITREELDADQITDLRDIGRLTPGASFSNSTGGFNIRGLDRNRVLTTIDGIRVPWLEDGARGVQGGIASFDLNTLSQIDLIKGSDSSVFGSGALGGVAALRTLEPEDLIEPGKNWGGVSKGGYDSRDESWSVDQALAARFDDTYFMVQGGYRNGHEMDNKGNLSVFDSTRTSPNPTDYDQESLLAKLKHRFDGGHTFGLTGEYFNREDDVDDRTAPTTDTTQYVPGSAKRDELTRRERISANYSYDGGGFFDAADAVVYWQRQQLGDDFSGVRLTAPLGDYRRDNTREEETYGISGSVLKEFDTGNLSHAVSFGGELFASEASSYSKGEDSCGPGPFPPFHSCNFLHSNQADMPVVDGTTLGLFVQDEISFFDGRFRLTPGLRYDWYEQRPQETAGYEDNPNYDGTLPPSSSDDAFSGKLRAEYDLRENVTVYAQWAQAFRAPSANELYLDYGGPGTYLRLGNPDLKPETSNGFEIGALLGDDRFGGSISAFYNRYKNFIDGGEAVPSAEYPLGITPTINRPDVEIYGLELSAHYKHFTGWHGWAQAGAYVGRDIEEDLHLNTIPAAKAILGVGYATENWGTDLIFTAAAARNDVENERSKTPSYTLLDFTGWWSPAQLPGLTLRAGVYNIFDETYYEDGLDLADTVTNKEYFTEPGRNFRFSATYKF